MISKYNLFFVLMIFPIVIQAMNDNNQPTMASSPSVYLGLQTPQTCADTSSEIVAQSSSSFVAIVPPNLAEIDKKGSYLCDEEQCNFKSQGIISWQSHRNQAHGMAGGYCYQKTPGCGGWNNCKSTVGLLAHLIGVHALKLKVEKSVEEHSNATRSSSRKRARSHTPSSSSESENDDESSGYESAQNKKKYFACDIPNCQYILSGMRSWQRHRETQHKRGLACNLDNCGTTYVSPQKLVDHIQEGHLKRLNRTWQEYKINVASRPNNGHIESGFRTVARSSLVRRPSSRIQSSPVIRLDTSGNEQISESHKPVRQRLNNNNNSEIRNVTSSVVQQPESNRNFQEQSQSISSGQQPSLSNGQHTSSYALPNQKLQETILEQAGNADREVQILTIRSVNREQPTQIIQPRSYSPLFKELADQFAQQKIIIEKQAQEIQKIREQHNNQLQALHKTQQELSSHLEQYTLRTKSLLTQTKNEIMNNQGQTRNQIILLHRLTETYHKKISETQSTGLFPLTLPFMSSSLTQHAPLVQQMSTIQSPDSPKSINISATSSRIIPTPNQELLASFQARQTPTPTRNASTQDLNSLLNFDLSRNESR